jgi:hypothetical protein
VTSFLGRTGLSKVSGMGRARGRKKKPRWAAGPLSLREAREKSPRPLTSPSDVISVRFGHVETEAERKARIRRLVERLRSINEQKNIRPHSPYGHPRASVPQYGAISSWRTDHDKAQYAWDNRWCCVTGCGSLLTSMVARDCGTTVNAVTS